MGAKAPQPPSLAPPSLRKEMNFLEETHEKFYSGGVKMKNASDHQGENERQ